jgi:hypothetical protein
VPVEDTCPACGEEMTRSIHVGKDRIVRDVGNPEYVSVFVLPEFDENGDPNYVDVVSCRESG